MHAHHVPLIFIIGWGFFDVILVLILLSLLATVRVRIGDGAVTIQKALVGALCIRGGESQRATFSGRSRGCGDDYVDNTVYSQLRA